jgi:hypothetical protein
MRTLGKHKTDLYYTDLGKYYTDLGKYYTDLGRYYTDLGRYCTDLLELRAKPSHRGPAQARPRGIWVGGPCSPKDHTKT